MTKTNIMLTDDLLKQVAQRVNELILEKFDAEKHIGFEDYVPSEKFEKSIAEIFEKRRKMRSTRTLRTVIVIAAVLVTLFACALSVSAVRQAISKFMYSFNADHAVVYVNNEADTDVDSGYGKLTEIETYYEPSYIPEGFEEIQRTENKTKLIMYYKSNDGFIVYRQELMLDSSQVDNERAFSNEIDVNGTIGYYSNTGSETMVVWYSNGYVYKITSNLDTDSIIKIAENLE